jgi:hypothetical protein
MRCQEARPKELKSSRGELKSDCILCYYDVRWEMQDDRLISLRLSGRHG